MDVEGTGRDLI